MACRLLDTGYNRAVDDNSFKRTLSGDPIPLASATVFYGIWESKLHAGTFLSMIAAHHIDVVEALCIFYSGKLELIKSIYGSPGKTLIRVTREGVAGGGRRGM